MQSTPPGEPSPWGDGELYDIMCQGLDYGIDLYVAPARAAKGPVLDIACGTGRVLLPVLQAGMDADGMAGIIHPTDQVVLTLGTNRADAASFKAIAFWSCLAAGQPARSA
jgi:ubiquinone/menaquinone biosynthesis C-methylase UbiE